MRLKIDNQLLEISDEIDTIRIFANDYGVTSEQQGLINQIDSLVFRLSETFKA